MKQTNGKGARGKKNTSRRNNLKSGLTPAQLKAEMLKTGEITMLVPDGGSEKWTKTLKEKVLLADAKSAHKGIMLSYSKKRLNPGEPTTFYL